MLQCLQAVAQAHRAVGQPQAAGIEPKALLGLAQRVVHPPDLEAEGTRLRQPVARGDRDIPLDEPGGHPGQQVGHLAAEVFDGLLGRLHLRRREYEPGY